MSPPIRPPDGRSIVVICGDPGGAAAVAPVIGALRAGGGAEVTVLTYRQATAVLGRSGIETEEIDAETDVRAAEAILAERHASLLVTATSVNGIDLEKAFIAAARESGVPSLAVLDYWSNYRQRFADNDGCLAYQPDRIAVMDARARDEMTSLGFDSARLAVTGQPAFDALAEFRRAWDPRRSDAVRSALGVDAGAKLVLFASQPIAAFYGGPDSASFIGYTEHTVIALLVPALERIAREAGIPISLVIRPHPRENVADLQLYTSDGIQVVVDDRQESRAATMSADLVTGMNSVLLVEAAYLGKTVLSLQPGLRIADTVPTNATGLSRIVSRAEDIQGEVAGALTASGSTNEACQRSTRALPDQHATRRVTDLAYSMIAAQEQDR